jgi:hypothetical protein
MGSITFALLLAAAAPVAPPGFGLWARPVGTIEFLEESGVERWRVRVAGEEVQVRIQGSGCTFLGEIPRGYVTVLFDNLEFATTSGRRCQVTAIER